MNVESQNGLVWKGPFKIIESSHPARLLKAPSNLTLNTSRDGAPTASLGNLFQCLTTLSILKEVFANYCSSCGLEDAFLPTEILSNVKEDGVEVENFL